jgi:hypothetical protein
MQSASSLDRAGRRRFAGHPRGFHEGRAPQTRACAIHLIRRRSRRLFRSLHNFDTPDAAQAFFANEQLKEGMQKAGVHGPLRIELHQDA